MSREVYRTAGPLFDEYGAARNVVGVSESLGAVDLCSDELDCLVEQLVASSRGYVEDGRCTPRECLVAKRPPRGKIHDKPEPPMRWQAMGLRPPAGMARRGRG